MLYAGEGSRNDADAISLELPALPVAIKSMKQTRKTTKKENPRRVIVGGFSFAVTGAELFRVG